MPFVSICIPSYNRPDELIRLLRSINTDCTNDIDILICEDKSPKRDEIIKSVAAFKEQSPLSIELVLNPQNLGYDANIRNLIGRAKGEYIIFMGDDDVFDTANLPLFINFLRNNRQLGYVLKTHTFVHKDGNKELFKYYPEDKFFDQGVDAYQSLFRKSVLISGFCMKRDYALSYQTTRFDGGLLYQLYILAEIALHYPVAFCTIPLTIQDERLRGVPMFGTAENEKGLYKPGEIVVENSLNFMDGFFKITDFIDEKYELNSSEFMKTNFSKYAYPILSIQRNRGRRVFKEYCRQLRKRIDIDRTFYYHVYSYSLLVFGKSFCDKVILSIKKLLGRTPNL